MIFDWLYVGGGLTLLILGGDALVRGASGIALLAKISPAVVGLTIVAAGTSMPELVVSVQSAFAERSGLALGNVVGSNIFNIAAILGLTALIRPLRVEGDAVRLQWPVMMFAAVLFHLLTRDGLLDRVEGVSFLVLLIYFVWYTVWISRKNPISHTQHTTDDVPTIATAKRKSTQLIIQIGAVLIGGLLLAFGASVLVKGAVGLATDFGVSDTIIGLTIVAIGTSTPELITSIIAALRGRDDIAVGNIIGSNIFNILAIAGTTAAIHPVTVPAEMINRDNLWMLGISLLMLPIIRTGMTISRKEGTLLLAVIISYTTILIKGI